MRVTGCADSASSRSSEIARWAPRLSSAIAWISSTMTRAHVAKDFAALVRRQQDVERLGRGHENVRWTPEHRSARRQRWCRPFGPRCGSPARERRAPRPARRSRPAGHRDSAGCRCPGPSAATRRRRACGRRACRRPPDGRARRCTRERPRVSCPSRSAQRSVCSGPTRIDGQPSNCGSVGVPKRPMNQSRTIGCAHSRPVGGGGADPGSPAAILKY